MSSSDSDEGLYSNKRIIKARQECLKNLKSAQYDLTENSGKNQLSSGCGAESSDLGVKLVAESTENVSNNTSNGLYDDLDKDNLIDEIIAKNSKPARGRGRKKKDTFCDLPTPKGTATTARGRGRGRGRGAKRGKTAKTHDPERQINAVLDKMELLNGAEDAPEAANAMMVDIMNSMGDFRSSSNREGSPNSCLNEVIEHLCNTARINIRGRGRSRGRGRGRPRTQPPSAPDVPLFISIGNTDEYPDFSDDIPLFSGPTNSQAIAEPETIDLDEELLSVKIIWKSMEVVKFQLRKCQKFTEIFDLFAEKENVTKDKLLFTYNDQILTSDDTPASIDYNVAKFIDGGVVSHSVTDILKEKAKINGIRIKFQCQDSKKPFEMTVGNDETLQTAMNFCAEHMMTPLHNLKFKFDGDVVTGFLTPQEMGLENNDCIDVVILNYN